MPFNTLPSVSMGNQPTGMVTQNGNPWAGALSGGMQGGLAAYSMFGGGQGQAQPTNFGSGNPYNTGIYGGGGYSGNPYNVGQYGTTAYGM